MSDLETQAWFMSAWLMAKEYAPTPRFGFHAKRCYVMTDSYPRLINCNCDVDRATGEAYRAWMGWVNDRE